MADLTETTATTKSPSKKVAPKKATPAKAPKAKVEPKTKKPTKVAQDGSLRGVAKPAGWKPERQLMATYLADPKPENMNTAQGRVLALLTKSKGPVNRATISEKCGITDSYVGVWVGRNEAEDRKESEAKWGYVSLISMGYVKNKRLDVAGKAEWVFEITASGKAALVKYEKAVAAKLTAKKEAEREKAARAKERAKAAK